MSFVHVPIPFDQWSTYSPPLEEKIQNKLQVMECPNNFSFVPPSSPKTLEIQSWQTEWYNKARNILTSNHGYIDTSEMRSGKTYIALKLALEFKWKIFVVCPVIATGVWKKTAAEYGVEVIDAISYETLRSKVGFPCNHSYLTRHDYTTEGGVKQVKFTCTEKYLQLVQGGILVIFDEIHKIKKKSDQYDACATLLKPIYINGGLSRYALISGTPLDKQEHVKFLLKLIGYIRAPRLYSGSGSTIVFEGIQELVNICGNINPEETTAVLQEIPAIKGRMDDLCLALYSRVVKSHISGAMASPDNITGKQYQMNGYFILPEDKAKELSAAIRRLASAVQYKDGQSVGINRDNIGEVTKELVTIEKIKAPTLGRLVYEDMMRNKTDKAVVCVNYKEEILPELLYYFAAFEPLVLNGDIKNNEVKLEIARRFREHPQCRVIIINPKAAGVAISLYNNLPNCNIRMYVSPSYCFLDIVQAVARVRGPGMVSDAYITMVYGKGDAVLESGIMASLARKSEVLKQVQEEHIVAKNKYPDEWQNYVEEINVQRP